MIVKVYSIGGKKTKTLGGVNKISRGKKINNVYN